MSFDWKNTLATVAPKLALAIANPAAGLAAIATDVIGAALGLGKGSPEDVVAAAITAATPADLQKLKEAEYKFTTDMKSLDIDLERIFMEDRKSAREREVAVGGKMTSSLALLVVGAFVGVVVYLVCWRTAGIDHELSLLIGTLVGYLSAKSELVLAYYFGSSKGSDDKNKILSAFFKEEA